jgi:hypothetical protein
MSATTCRCSWTGSRLASTAPHTAEDLIVLKAFADRPKDWLDIDGILIRQSASLDWDYVRAQLAPLAELKDAPELVDKLDRRRIDLTD